MAGNHRKPCIWLTRTTTMASTCPNCGLTFHNDTAVLKHMNHRFSSCHTWFTRDSPPPDTQPPLDTDTSTPSDTSLSSDYFPGAGHVFGSGPGFFGSFQGDPSAGAWSPNLYHPFLSKGEWEIAAFLSCSSLSIKLINELLSLSLVGYQITSNAMMLILSIPDNWAGPFFSMCTNLTWKS